MKILTLNAGSSSLKYKLFDGDNFNGDGVTTLAEGNFEKIWQKDSFLTHKVLNGEKQTLKEYLADHRAALTKVLNILTDPEHGVLKSLNEIDAIGHRVVHGGETFKASTLITQEVKDKIREMISLAPLHNPANLTCIEECEDLLPGIPNVAVFDTAFHQTIEEEHFYYPVDTEYYEKDGKRRYGFHGSSHRYVSQKACQILNLDYEQTNIISCHIGNGGSVTGILNGASKMTSMGTPAGGVIMGTRTWDMDAGALMNIMRTEKFDIDPTDTVMKQLDAIMNHMDTIVNKKSGIKGLSGGKTSDLRDVIAGYEAGQQRAIRAMKMYVNSILGYIAKYAILMERVDVIVMTAGVLERSPLVRRLIMEKLGILGIQLDETKNSFSEGGGIISTPESEVTVIVVPTDEEKMIAQDTYNLTQ